MSFPSSDATYFTIPALTRIETDSRVFAHTRWDALPAPGGFANLAYVFFLLWAFPRLPWWALVPLGLIYSLSITCIRSEAKSRAGDTAMG